LFGFLFINETTVWPIVPALDDNDDDDDDGGGGAISVMNDWQEKLKYPKKTCPNAVLSTASPHMT
jgi:hypothetical protein